jgi:asparaginyl-tRNA synthetase
MIGVNPQQMTRIEESDGVDLSMYERVEIEEIKKEVHAGKPVRVFGWVKSVKIQKVNAFITLGARFSQLKCVYPGSDMRGVTVETSLALYGIVEKNTRMDADRYPVELIVEKFEVIGGKCAPPFPLQETTDRKICALQPHHWIRLNSRAPLLKTRACLMKIMRDFYYSAGYTEITPPTMVQTQVEGGSTLFHLDYYGKDAYLTQSSQFYLETVVPVTQRAYCIAQSYRAEKSNTTRHLSEYSHVEAELADISFDQLLSSIEDIVVYSMREFYGEMRDYILKVYPGFEFVEVPERPFKRVKYEDAIEILKDHKILKSNSEPYRYGDDISDSAEVALIDIVGGGMPIFLTHFPKEVKSFYMQRVPSSKGELTESCDLLFPGIGEVVGGSIRCHDSDELVRRLVEEESADPEKYEAYTDVSKYGPSRHGGYGLGFERLYMALMRLKTVRDACLYPRFPGRCTP